MLKKMVDGKEIICSEKEEKNTRLFWDLNDKYPEYVGSCAFDGVNAPYHIIEEVKKTHQSLLNNSCLSAIKKINEKIERAQENEEDTKELFKERKRINEFANMQIDHLNTVDELKNSIPKELLPHWRKL